jgi:hypothetical protein
LGGAAYTDIIMVIQTLKKILTIQDVLDIGTLGIIIGNQVSLQESQLRANLLIQ